MHAEQSDVEGVQLFGGESDGRLCFKTTCHANVWRHLSVIVAGLEFNALSIRARYSQRTFYAFKKLSAI